MGLHNHEPMRGQHPETRKFVGSFAVNGGSSPVDVAGKNVVVTRTGVGLYQVLIPRKFAKYLGAFASYQGAGAAVVDVQAQVLNVVASGANTLMTIGLQVPSTGLAIGADIAAGAGKRVNFEINFSESRV